MFETLAQRPCLVAFQNAERPTGAINPLSRYCSISSFSEQNRASGGGGGATHAWLPLPAVPVRQISGSRIDIVKACHHGTWSGSPSCFTTQKIAEKHAYPHGPMHPNMEALTLRPEEKTNSAHTQTFTGDWV